MARAGIVSATEAVLTASHVPLCVFVELTFPSGTLRFTNSGHAIEWDGETWLGAGELAQIEPIAEVANPQAAGLNVQFSGIDPTYVEAILDDHYQGNPARIWIATLDDGMEVEGEPILVFAGRLDEPVVTIGRMAEIQLGIENRFSDWDRARYRTNSDADQKARHATDRFFESVAGMESTSIHWGTYRGPVAPDPLKQFNRTLDKAARYIPGAQQLVIQPLRRVGDTIAKIFGF
jgi:hypothetical protein